MIYPDYKYHERGKEHPAADVAERRRHPRMELQVALRCIRLDPDCGRATELLRAVDISRSGMGATANRPFYPGQRTVLCMPLTDVTGRRNIYATVVRCTASHDGGYCLGLKFDAPAVDSWCGMSRGAVAA